jgi:predicted AlkP superfamily pyrophosphatase or phosphodiesterase
VSARVRRAVAGLGVALGLACANGGVPGLPAPEPGVPHPLLLVSIPGMTAPQLRPDAEGHVAMPSVAALAAAGAFAARVETVLPAASYPTHATLVTGRIPAMHGVASDHPLGPYGVRAATFAHASALRTPTLWQRVDEVGGNVAALDWPTTQGAEIRWLVPDVPPLRRGQTWLEALADGTTPPLRRRLAAHGALDAAASLPGPVRDAALVGVACEVLAGNPPPDLLLLRLGQTQGAWTAGPASPAAAAAFAGADAELARLLRCLGRSGQLSATAVVVVGGHAPAAVHTAVAPNVALAERGLRSPHRAEDWRALTRSNGGTAFVYARTESAAVAARLALRSAAEESGAFRVIPAAEMIELQADPEAWFGLEAFPGFAFVDAAEGPVLRAAPGRGASGYLPGRAETAPAFVAWGRGVRAGILIPEMQQTDVAPTLARMLDVELAGAEGRALVGILDLESAVAAKRGDE